MPWKNKHALQSEKASCYGNLKINTVEFISPKELTIFGAMIANGFTCRKKLTVMMASPTKSWPVLSAEIYKNL